MSADAASLFERAEDYSKDENYSAAAPLYDQAVTAAAGSASLGRYLTNRAHNSIKLKRYAQALQDCDEALRLDAKNPRALHRRALALFYLDRFAEAQGAFNDAKAAGFEGDLSLWLRKCTAEMEREASGAKVVSAPTAAAAPVVHKIEALPAAKKETPAAAAPPQPVGPLTLGQKTREQWFQIANEVTVTLLAKNLTRDQVSVSLDEPTATLTAKLSFPADGSEFVRSWKLFAQVQGEPAINLTPYKVEIILQKGSAYTWDALERKGDALPAVVVVPTAAAAASVSVPEAVVARPNVVSEVNYAAYPTSSKTLKNWEEVEAAAKKAEEEEKPEGEAALQKLFQSIYGGADEDTRRAMIKSFQTSGGTVLSTNWKEVKEKDYTKDLEAPKGQEVHRWGEK